MQPSIVAEIRSLGWELQQQDFIRIVLTDMPAGADPGNYSDWIFTSQHAVRSVAEALKPLSAGRNVYCLEGATRAALNELLPGVSVKATAPDASELADRILEQPIGSPVFFCGDIRRDELPRKLQKAGLNLEEIVVYETHPVHETFSGVADVYLFFSPSAVNSFFENNTIPPKKICVAIGGTTASAILYNDDSATVVTAEHPTQQAVLEALKIINQTQSFES